MSESIIAQRLKELIKEKGLNPKQAARAIDMPYTTIISLLTGRTENPTSNTLRTLAKYFNVTADHLLGFKPYTKAEVMSKLPRKTFKNEVKKMPVITLKEVNSWASDPDPLLSSKNTSYYYHDFNFNPQAFAVRLEDGSFRPRYLSDSILLVNPQDEYLADDMVVCSIDGKLSTIRKLVSDSGLLSLKSVSLVMPSHKIDENTVIHGKIEKTIIKSLKIEAFRRTSCTL